MKLLKIHFYNLEDIKKIVTFANQNNIFNFKKNKKTSVFTSMICFNSSH